jgi:glucose-1-phosphate adenylyltransferase
VLLVLSADHLYKLDFRDVIESHQARGAEVTMVTTQVPREQASRFGVVQTDSDGRVRHFQYKPDNPPDEGVKSTVTTEVFVYEPTVLLDTLDTLAAQNDGNSSDGENGENSSGLKDFGHELLPHLVGRGKAWAFPLDGYWRDVGTVESYWQAHQDLLASEPALVPDDPGWPIRTYVPMRAPARVLDTARLDNSLVSPGCVVGGQVIRSVLGPGVVIEAGATVRDSVLGSNVLVAAGACIECAVVDEDAHVGASAAIGSSATSNDNAAPDLTLIGRGVRVPDNARIEPGSRLSPPGE